MANLQSRQHGWLGVRGRTSLTLQIFIALLFSLSCQVNRVKKSSFEAAVKKIYPKQSPSNVPKVDGSKLTVHSVDVKKHRIKTQDMNAIDVKVDADEDSDYQRLVVCKDGSATECSPALSSPELFDIERVQRQVPYGLVIVQVQTCVFPKNAIDPKRNCGPWKQVHFRNESCAGETCPELPPDPADVYKLLCAEIEKALKDYQGAPIDEVPADIMARAERSVEEQLQIPISNFVNINHPMNCPLVIERHKELANKNMLGAAFLIGLGLTTAIVGGMLIYKGRPRSVATEILADDPSTKTTDIPVLEPRNPGTLTEEKFKVKELEARLVQARIKLEELDSKQRKPVSPGNDPGNGTNLKSLKEQLALLNAELGKLPTATAFPSPILTLKSLDKLENNVARLRTEAGIVVIPAPLGDRKFDTPGTLGPAIYPKDEIAKLKAEISQLKAELSGLNAQVYEKERAFSTAERDVTSLGEALKRVRARRLGKPDLPTDQRLDLIKELEQALQPFKKLLDESKLRHAVLGGASNAGFTNMQKYLSSIINSLFRKDEKDPSKKFTDFLTELSKLRSTLEQLESGGVTMDNENGELRGISGTSSITEALRTTLEARIKKRYGDTGTIAMAVEQAAARNDSGWLKSQISNLFRAPGLDMFAMFYRSMVETHCKNIDQVVSGVDIADAAHSDAMRRYNLDMEKYDRDKKILDEDISKAQEQFDLAKAKRDRLKAELAGLQARITTITKLIPLKEDKIRRLERNYLRDEQLFKAQQRDNQRISDQKAAHQKNVEAREADIRRLTADKATLEVRLIEAEKILSAARQENDQKAKFNRVAKNYEEGANKINTDAIAARITALAGERDRLQNEIARITDKNKEIEKDRGKYQEAQKGIFESKEDVARQILAQKEIIERLQIELQLELAKQTEYEAKIAAHGIAVANYSDQLNQFKAEEAQKSEAAEQAKRIRASEQARINASNDEKIRIAKAKTSPIMVGFGALLAGAGLGVVAAGTAAAVSYSQGGEDPVPGKPSEATGDALEQIFGLSEENSQSIPAPEDGVSPFRTLVNKLNKINAKIQQLWIDEEAYKVQIKKLEEKYSEGSEETPPTETQEPATVE